MAFDNSVCGLVWGNEVDEDIFLRWAQGFVFSSAEPLALVQYSGGPCAILAAVQGFMLQRHLFQSAEDFYVDSDHWRECSETKAYDLLVQALVHILAQAASNGLSVAFLRDQKLNALQLRSQKPKGEEPASCEPHPMGESHTQPTGPSPMDVDSTATGTPVAPDPSSPAGADNTGSHVTSQHPSLSSRVGIEAGPPNAAGEHNMVLSPTAMDDFFRTVSQSRYGDGTLGVAREELHTFTVDSVSSTLQSMAREEKMDKGDTQGGSGNPVPLAPDLVSPEGKRAKLETPLVTVKDGAGSVAGVIEQFHRHIGVATFRTSSDAQCFLHENICDLKGPFGVLLFLYSLVLTKGNAGGPLLVHWASSGKYITSQGIQNLREELEDPLIHGVHGYGSQNLVNLLLVGRAATNVFDHDKDLEGIKLRGIPRQASVGFLTLLEAFRYCEVGSFLKSPVYPIWVTGSETHLTLTFSLENHLASPENFATIATREFGKLDQEGNGFVPSNALRSLLTTLGLETDPDYVSYMVAKLDPESLGMILLGNFLTEFCPNMPGEATPPLAFPICHYNGLVQSNKDGKVVFARGSAVVLPETTGLSAADTLLNCLHSKWPGLVVSWEGEVEPKIN